MILARDRVLFTVVQLGSLEREEVHNAIGLANSTQSAFEFVLDPRRYPVASKYRLRNGGWDLDAAAQEILRKRTLGRPLIFLSSLPYSTRECQDGAADFFFADYGLDGDEAVSIVSTHLWNSLPGVRRPQPYVLFSLAAVTLGYRAGIEIHDDRNTQGCVFDYCDDPIEIDRALAVQELCPDCERQLNHALRSGRVGINELASGRRLLNRALNRRTAFVVMPFQREFDPVHGVIRRTLEGKGWQVLRADQVVQPRRITDAIVGAIMTSDLIVADLTGHNPNVFYELGFAHATGRDVIMMTQEKRLPFDVMVERAIFYRPSTRGLRSLERELYELVPPAG